MAAAAATAAFAALQRPASNEAAPVQFPPVVFGAPASSAQLANPNSPPVQAESGCYLKQIPIDPQLDAGIRISIPEEKWAASKIRVIPPSCNSAARITSYESFRATKVTVPAARKR
jgi:hypothetical protein